VILRHYIRKTENIKERYRDKRPINNQASEYIADILLIADIRNILKMQ
jgi:hypothetical protein